MSADSFIPTDDEIERERQRRRQLASAPPVRSPLPATVAELLAECERHRVPLVTAMRGGDFAGPLTDWPKALFIPPLEMLWQAAVVLNVGRVPPLPGKPVTALECVVALDALRTWCQTKLRSTSDSSQPDHKEPPAKGKRGGRKPLEEREPLKANLYNLICKAHQEGEQLIDTVARLKQSRDIETLARKVGVALNITTVRNAIEWERQRLARNRQRPLDNRLDGTPLYDGDD